MRGRFRVFSGQCKHGQQLYGVQCWDVERGERCERLCVVDPDNVSCGTGVRRWERERGQHLHVVQFW